MDGSSEATEAARQAATLTAPDGRLTLLTVWNVLPPTSGETGGAEFFDLDRRLEESYRRRDLAAVLRAVASSGSTAGRLVRGTAVDELLRESARGRYTLLALGDGKVGRLHGVFERSIGTEIVHAAPCSVLIARKSGRDFPRSIVAGVDGSVESARAHAAARHLAERFDAELRVLVARGGKAIDEDAVAAVAADHESTKREPVAALIAASKLADVVVVGSRGLHGLRSLGSVSERVAHGASASVLVVREAPWQRLAEELGD